MSPSPLQESTVATTLPQPYNVVMIADHRITLVDCNSVFDSIRHNFSILRQLQSCLTQLKMRFFPLHEKYAILSCPSRLLLNTLENIQTWNFFINICSETGASGHRYQTFAFTEWIDQIFNQSSPKCVFEVNSYNQVGHLLAVVL